MSMPAYKLTNGCGVPMHEALTPEQCRRMRRFLRALSWAASQYPGRRPNVGAVLSLWRDERREAQGKPRRVDGHPCRYTGPRPTPARDRVLALLSRGGEWHYREIAEATRRSPQAARHTLLSLHQDGLIDRVRPGVYRGIRR